MTKIFPALSPREWQVAQQIAKGHTYEVIAMNLCLGIESVRTYAKRIRKKLGFTSKVQVAIWMLNQQRRSNGAADTHTKRRRVAAVH